MSVATKEAREVVRREGSLRLYRYESARTAPPVVLVYSFINRPRILDLQPQRSVINSLRNAGHDVFLADWGDPGKLESTMGLEAHIDRLERACREAAKLAGSERVSVLGYCLGGTMALLLACVVPELVERVALLATPVSFEEGGTLATWARASLLEPASMARTPQGNVPGELLRELLRWLDPVGQVKKWVALAERSSDEAWLEGFLAQESWANDPVDFPGALYADLITSLYREDRLAKGTLPLRGRNVSLGELKGLRVLNLIGQGDRIVPEEASLILEKLAPEARIETLRMPGAHIGMTVGSKAVATTHAALCRFFAERS